MTLRVLGKGRKQRLVPLLPAVREALLAWLRLHPAPEAGRAAVRRRQRRPSRSGGGPQDDARLPPPRRPARARDPARPSPQLRDPPAGRRRRPSLDPGIAGPCQPVDHPALHQCRPGRPWRSLGAHSPEGLTGPLRVSSFWCRPPRLRFRPRLLLRPLPRTRLRPRRPLPPRRRLGTRAGPPSPLRRGRRRPP